MSLISIFLNNKYSKLLRYSISGCVAATTNLGVIYIFVDVFNFWYISASVISFAATFIVSFSLQKFWTFKDPDLDVIHKQVAISFTVAMVNLFLNTVYMYGLVEYVHLHYLQAQILTTIMIAVGSFIAYQYLVFKPRVMSVSIDQHSI